MNTPDTDPLSTLGAGLYSELRRALANHRWLIVGVALGTVLTTFIALQFVTETYESSMQLLVKLGRENTEVPATVEKGGVMSTGIRKEEINTEIQLLTSRQLIEETIDKLGVAAFSFDPAPPQTLLQTLKYYAKRTWRWVRAQGSDALILLNLRKRFNEREKAILLVERALRVERKKDSDVIVVAVRLPDPVLATTLVDTLVQHYLDKHVEVRSDRNMAEFFKEQLVTLGDRLSQLDVGRRNIRDKHRISAVSEERGLVSQRLQALYRDIADTERELRLLGAGEVTGDVADLSSYPNFDTLKRRITELRIKRNELLNRYLDSAEPLMQVEREIAELEHTQRQGLTAMVGEQRRQAQFLEKRLTELNAGETELDRLERDRSVANQNYLTYAKRWEDARVVEKMDLMRVSNIAVLSPAARPIEPVSPRKLLILGISIPFGLLLGLGLALLLEYVNDKIRGPEDIPDHADVTFLGLMHLR